MPKKISQDYVNQVFENTGCILLSEYKGAYEKLEYICLCGVKSKITFWSFKNGRRCKNCGMQKSAKSQRTSYDDVKQYFETQGCTLLSKAYDNSEENLRFICKCGHESEIKFSNFKMRKHCIECGKKEQKRKLLISEKKVADYFDKQGCILLSEYEGAKKNLKYICHCGNIGVTLFDNFRRQKTRCGKCIDGKIGTKYTFKHIKNYFKEQGCTLLSKEYKAANKKLEYICHCGRKSQITFSNFKKGQRCKKCWSLKQSYSFEYVKNYFKEQECTLLSKEYKAAHGILKYICCCGEKNTTSFSNFKSGKRCKKCGIKKRNKNNLKKYGVENPGGLPEFRKKASKTLLSRYGVSALHLLPESKGYSKNSQKLFWEIYKQLPDKLQLDTWFAENKCEYMTADEENKTVRYYDFTIPSIKKCIEFNGIVFHAQPNLLSTMKGWHAFEPERTAQKQWDMDKYKNGLLEAEGFEIFTIWEDEENQLEKCLEFLEIA